jgi:hypothetical protein
MNQPDLSHLHALEFSLHNERQRLAASRTESARALRSVWVAQLEREIIGERRFLGLADEPDDTPMSDDELLVALEA